MCILLILFIYVKLIIAKEGVFVTAIITAFFYLLAKLPYLSVMGRLVIAIMIGMLLKTLISVPISLNTGISFSNKRLLKIKTQQQALQL
ncbi:putative sulfate exporter family transporter [Priestia endophytica]|uniref:putative sulfate exporter family transporter n=1 Tax=Priestia endophytica TaxID=135735 RepID=UPI002DDD9AEA|nr:putative sulfate exporter family transporter [Priestia endophytica]